MFCPNCGAPNDDNAFRCVRCQGFVQPVAVPSSTPLGEPLPARPKRLGDDPAMRLLLPVGRSGLAIAAGWVGLFSFLIWIAPIAIVLGILAIRDLQAHPEKHGMGRAVFGIIMGAMGTTALISRSFLRC